MKISISKQIIFKTLFRSKLQYISLCSLCLITLLACNQFSLYNEIELNLPKPLIISPTRIILQQGETCDFSASGGKIPYFYSALSGGGSIEPATGVYTAPSDLGGLDLMQSTIRVMDAKGMTSETTVVVLNPVAIQPVFITPKSLTTTVGTTDLIFTVAEGKRLPDKPYYTLEVLGTGSIRYLDNETQSQWVYTARPEPGQDQILVKDALGNIDIAIIDCVAAAANPVIVSPSVATQKAESEEYFSVTGGTPPYSYTIRYPHLPELVISGLLTIEPYSIKHTAPHDPGQAILTVTDSSENSLSATAEITIFSNSTTPLRLSPQQSSLNVGGTCTFKVVNGQITDVYVFSLVFGPGQIDSVSGLYTAPASAGKNNKTAKVKVKAQTGETAYAFVIIN
jgi:hypothetical protein